MKYIFRHRVRLKKEFLNKNIFLFLDYDGTLTPIVESPDKAILSKKTKVLLERLSKDRGCKLAIISGRSLKDIKERVGLKDLIYVGNHGLEIEGPKIRFRNFISQRYRKILERIKEVLNKKLTNIKGAFIEDKGLTLTIHYRLVNKSDIPLVETIFREAIILYRVRNQIKIRYGKMFFEIRPPINWDKGKVVLWLLAREQFKRTIRTILPIYIGDDVTDEDAFKVLKNKGLTIFVGEPKRSYAKYYLRDTDEVSDFLNRICQS